MSPEEGVSAAGSLRTKGGGLRQRVVHRAGGAGVSEPGGERNPTPARQG